MVLLVAQLMAHARVRMVTLAHLVKIVSLLYIDETYSALSGPEIHFSNVSIAKSTELLVSIDLRLYMYRRYGSCDTNPDYYYSICCAVNFIACTPGTFGPACTKTCNCANGNCSNVDGICSCFGGYFGASCNTPCTTGRYGPDCLGVCDCQNGGVCSPVDGSCTCAAGFTGKSCSAGEFNVPSLYLLQWHW